MQEEKLTLPGVAQIDSLTYNGNIKLEYFYTIWIPNMIGLNGADIEAIKMGTNKFNLLNIILLDWPDTFIISV